MEIDPRKDVQRLHCGNEVYVVVREQLYDQLLHRLDGLHAALQAQKNRAKTSVNIVETLLKDKLTPAQVREVLDAPTFGKRLTLLRGFRGLAQIDLARRTGLVQSTISKLENGEISRPSHEVILKVFDGLGIPDLATYPLFKKEPMQAV